MLYVTGMKSRTIKYPGPVHGTAPVQYLIRGYDVDRPALEMSGHFPHLLFEVSFDPEVGFTQAAVGIPRLQ